MLAVACPPPTTALELQAAAIVVIEAAYRCEHGARTVVGTSGHAAALVLERARLLHWSGTTAPVDGGPALHIWKITHLGIHDYEEGI